MRNPSLILVATAVLSQSAFAVIDTSANDPVASAPATLAMGRGRGNPDAGADWRNVRFKDEAGIEHSLWCRRADCAAGKTGTVPLYSFEKEQSATVNTEEGVWPFKKKKSVVTKSADAKVSNYRLHMSATPPAAQAQGAKQSFPVAFQSDLGSAVTLKIKDTGAVADDLPTALSADEKYWLDKTSLEQYETRSAMNLTPDERAQLQKSTRTMGVLKHLPPFAHAEYKKLTSGAIDPSKVSVLLDSLISIKDPKELQALSEIKKGKGVGAHLDRDDALQSYRGKMATVLMGPDHRPVPPNALKAAIATVAEYRGLLRAHTGAPGKKPGHAAPGHSPSTEIVLNLTAPELDWLTPAERNAYEAKAAAKPSKSARLQLNKEYREAIKGNLPPAGKADYEAALAEMNPAAINAAIAKIPHYSGDDAALTAAEIEALAGITKDKAPAGSKVEQANAKIDYERAMKMARQPDGSLKGSQHVVAHQITVKYRDMLAAAGIKVPGAPAGTQPGAKPTDGTTPVGSAPSARKLKLTDEELALLTNAERTAYDLAYKEAKTDDERADLVAKYQQAVDERKAMKDPQSVQDFDGMTKAQKEKYCEVHVAPSNGAAATTTTSGAQNQLKAASPTTDAADGMVDGNTTAGKGKLTVEPAKPAVPAKSSAPGKAPDAALQAQLKKACDEFIANLPAGGTIGDGKGKTVKGDVPAAPCGGGTAKPGDKPGTDKECPGPDKKAGDPAFYKNLATGMSFGIFGLVLGSFFGGPLVMFAAAAVIGGGAFALSKHLNPPPKKKDE